MTIVVLGAARGREVDGGGLGQLLGMVIHHAVCLSKPGAMVAVAVPVIGQALFAALVASAGVAASLL